MPVGVGNLAARLRAFLVVTAATAALAGGQGASAAPAAQRADLAAAVSGRSLLRDGTGLYPRAVRLAHNGSANGRIIAGVTTFSAGNGIGVIYQSTDGGQSFQQIGSINDPQAAAGNGQCCATLYELPSAVGANPAGTLLWAAAMGGAVTTNRRMSLRVWRSTDAGHTWSYLSTIAAAGNDKGLWEPEFTVDSGGGLVAFYSDETDPAHSQKIMKVRSVDGVNWTDRAGAVVASTQAYRPGMPVVRRLPDGRYLMSYEICGTGNQYGCAAYTRSSADGWNWGTASSLGSRAVSVSGDYFRHAPTIAVSPAPEPSGTLLLIGQMLYDSSGAVAPGNGSTIFARPLDGSGGWHEISAPVDVPDATNNYCPNYSSALLPATDGSALLEIATDYDGTVCKPYYATGPID
jgi:hypothetical protein